MRKRKSARRKRGLEKLDDMNRKREKQETNGVRNEKCDKIEE